MNTSTENIETKTWEQKQEEQRAQETLAGKLTMEKLHAIVKALGHTIKDQTDEENIRWHLFVVTNEGIYLEAGKREWKIFVSGSFPRTKTGEYISPTKYNEPTNKISISLNKPPKQIAKEIERRFMPTHLKQVAYVQEQIKRSDDYQDKSINALVELKGFGLDDFERTNKKISIPCEGEKKFYGNIHAHGDSIRMEIGSLTLDQAKAMLKALNGVKS